MNFDRSVAMLLVACVVAMTSSPAEAEPATPALTAVQQAKLKKIQAQFVPGGTSNVQGYGFGKLSEFCGANIPMEIHPSMVALETAKADDRTGIDSACQNFANSVVYLCGSRPDADPVVKEMIRASVKRMVCRATSNTSELSRFGLKYTLENGTLTLVVGAKDGNLILNDISEEGTKFLKSNVRRGPDGLSIGGHQIRQKMLNDLSLKENSLRRGIKDKCGIDVTVAVDDKLPEHYSKHEGHAPLSHCDGGLQTLYNSCQASADSEIASMAIKAAVRKNLKGVSCVYSETESVAVRPNGILEFGGSVDAPRPRWQGQNMVSFEGYVLKYLKANIGSLGSASPTNAASAAPPATPSSPPRRPDQRQ